MYHHVLTLGLAMPQTTLVDGSGGSLRTVLYQFGCSTVAVNSSAER